jgi:sulfite dehydrogenase (cytochrome) subunit B
MKHSVFTAALCLVVMSAANGEEQSVPLIDAPGREVVANNCAVCHSLDYVRTNAPFMGHKMWQAEIDKMINVFGARIDPNDAQVIIEYLVQHYGAAP